MKTLVVILCLTRCSDQTFKNIKKHLIDELNADVCVCIGVKPDYDYEDPFYKLAKYRFLYKEPDNCADAFDEGYQKIVQTHPMKPGHIHWREFIQFEGNAWGGIDGRHFRSAMQTFLRWFLLENLREHDLIKKYDRFVITRSDFFYTLPHPQLTLLDPEHVWTMNSEHHGGLNDRHAVLSQDNIVDYLNIFYCLVAHSKEYWHKLNRYIQLHVNTPSKPNYLNVERLVYFHLKHYAQVSVREFPYIAYIVRDENPKYQRIDNPLLPLQHRIKRYSEYLLASLYKTLCDRSDESIANFYKTHIQSQDKTIAQFINLYVMPLKKAIYTQRYHIKMRRKQAKLKFKIHQFMRKYLLPNGFKKI